MLTSKVSQEGSGSEEDESGEDRPQHASGNEEGLTMLKCAEVYVRNSRIQGTFAPPLGRDKYLVTAKYWEHVVKILSHRPRST